MLVLVLSDFHLGKGLYLDDGTVNTLEDFDEDEKFSEFLDHYSTGTYYFTDVHLILNGDILNLIQMDVDGVYTHLLSEDHIVKMVEGIIEGHPIFFSNLRKFLSRPNKKLSYVIGNHDIGMIFEKAQKKFAEAVEAEIVFTHQLVTNGLLVEHGHRFEPMNTVPRSKLLIMGPGEIPILNLPWNSLFCIYLLPKLKELRPHFDKVRPISLYIWWTLIHDTRFFMYLAWVVITYCIRTQFPPYGKYNKNFRLKLREVLTTTVHPKYEKFAKRIFATRPDVQVVVMGHTHITEWRKFKDGKQYFNCGTWNHVPSMDKALHKNINSLHYVAVEINEKKQEIKTATLNIWQGKWRPFREVIIT